MPRPPKKQPKRKNAKPSRGIPPQTQAELWGRAAGRCQFPTCNKIVYLSESTSEAVNVADKAHIEPFASKGPRGDGQPRSASIHECDNLMLLCKGCHKTIDDPGTAGRYPEDLLRKWKKEHEDRVRRVTGIKSSRKSNVVLYRGRIGAITSEQQHLLAVDAMFQEGWFPQSDRPIELKMVSELEDSTPEFWRTEAEHLRRRFNREIKPLIEQDRLLHFSVFALANQPLLVLLGSLFTDQVPAEVYQPHRNPHRWAWPATSGSIDYHIRRPDNCLGTPVLLVSLSATIARSRIADAVLAPHSVWEITIPAPSPHFLTSKEQLTEFGKVIRKVVDDIRVSCPAAGQILVFPAMPAACAVEMGRVRLPKSDRPWRFFDQNNTHNRFSESLTIS
ncbi:MAG: SAVED domain-containing protein [Verrucomicrobiales bacterium]|nr:SAVED domain-containing protein [Verrucomicrobiales bacterium]